MFFIFGGTFFSSMAQTHVDIPHAWLTPLVQGLQNGAKNLGEGASTRYRGPQSDKCRDLAFCHNCGAAFSPDLGDWWQTVYGVLYYVQWTADVPSLAPLARKPRKYCSLTNAPITTHKLAQIPTQ